MLSNKRIPTIIITGFLGVGKTSTILQLLKHKPSHELWAVLVNEFGEVGVDGSFFEGEYQHEQGVFIREVPGGCMCCTAGLNMKRALDRLLIKSKPDRLLIEPTGLGHPKEILRTLLSQHYKDKLVLQHVVTVVDARLVSLDFYAEHSIFMEQLSIADLIIANKADLYKQDDEQKLRQYIKKHAPVHAKTLITSHGLLDLNVLLADTGNVLDSSRCDFSESHSLDSKEVLMSDQGLTPSSKSHSKLKSVGWRFPERDIFDSNKLDLFFSGLNVLRMKATFMTQEGAFSYNLTQDGVSKLIHTHFQDNRIEIINSVTHPGWEQQLRDCLFN